MKTARHCLLFFAPLCAITAVPTGTLEPSLGEGCVGRFAIDDRLCKGRLARPYSFAGYGVPSRWMYPGPAAIMSMSGYVQRSCGSELPISSTVARLPDLFTR